MSGVFRCFLVFFWSLVLGWRSSFWRALPSFWLDCYLGNSSKKMKRACPVVRFLSQSWEMAGGRLDNGGALWFDDWWGSMLALLPASRCTHTKNYSCTCFHFSMMAQQHRNYWRKQPLHSSRRLLCRGCFVWRNCDQHVIPFLQLPSYTFEGEEEEDEDNDDEA